LKEELSFCLQNKSQFELPFPESNFAPLLNFYVLSAILVFNVALLTNALNT